MLIVPIDFLIAATESVDDTFNELDVINVAVGIAVILLLIDNDVVAVSGVSTPTAVIFDVIGSVVEPTNVALGVTVIVVLDDNDDAPDIGASIPSAVIVAVIGNVTEASFIAVGVAVTVADAINNDAPMSKSMLSTPPST